MFLSYLEAGMETPSDLTFSSFEGLEIHKAGLDQFNPFLKKLFGHPVAITWLEQEAPYLFTQQFMDVFYEYGPLKS